MALASIGTVCKGWLGNLGNELFLPNFKAGGSWLRGFRNRYPELARRRAQYFERNRAGAMNPKLIDAYFHDVLGKAVERIKEWNGIDDLREYCANLDESAVQSEPNNAGFVITRRGRKSVHKVSAGKGIHNTECSVVWSNGDAEDEFWVVSGERRDPKYAQPDGTCSDSMGGGGAYCTMNSNGYMTDRIWEDEFVPWLIRQCDVRRSRLGHKAACWYLLTMDGYGSHTLTPKALSDLWEAHIYCICFPSHTSSELQPLDKSCFGPMKHFFKSILEARVRDSLETAVTKWELCELMHQARLRSHNVKDRMAGFKACDIWPSDVDWVKDNQDKLKVSTFFNKDEKTDTQQAEEALAEYVNLVVDFGPRDALQAAHATRHCPYVDSPAGPTGFAQMAALSDQADACSVQAFTRRAVLRSMKKPKQKTRDRAQRIRTNIAGESFATAKWLNEPVRTDVLTDVRAQQAEKAAEQAEKADARDLVAAGEVFLLQSMKKLQFTPQLKKSVTVSSMKSFFDKNPASDIEHKKCKNRPELVAACRKHIGRPCTEGFVCADDSRLELVIPPGHGWVEPAAAEDGQPAAAAEGE